MHMDLVPVGEWFVTVIKTTSGKHTKLCMKSQTIRGLVKYEKKAEMTKMDHLASIDEKQKHSELPLCTSRVSSQIIFKQRYFVLHYFTKMRTLIFRSK